MKRSSAFWFTFAISVAVLFGCAAPAPTATPTAPVAAAPTPTKSPAATPTKRPLVKAMVVISSIHVMHTPVLAARAKGYFQEEGLDIEWVLVESGAKALAAAVGRSADIALPAAADVVNAVTQGQPVQNFGVVLLRSNTEWVVTKELATRKGLTPESSLEDRVRSLRGLRMALSSPGSALDLNTRYLLNKYNIDPERELELTYVGLSGLLPAFCQGAGEARFSL